MCVTNQWCTGKVREVLAPAPCMARPKDVASSIFTSGTNLYAKILSVHVQYHNKLSIVHAN